MSIQGVVGGASGAPSHTDGAHAPIDRATRQGGVLADALQPVLSSSGRLQAVADRSYWHPNGFLKVVLSGESGRAQRRLHVWTSADEGGDIHDHAWSYSSIVVAGTVQEVAYTEVAPTCGPRLWRHSYGMVGPRRFHLDAPIEIGLEVGEARAAGPGERLGGDAGHIHRFWAATAPTITLVAVEPASRQVSHVYRAEPVLERSVVPRPTTAAEVAFWVDRALWAPWTA